MLDNMINNYSFKIIAASEIHDEKKHGKEPGFSKYLKEKGDIELAKKYDEYLEEIRVFYKAKIDEIVTESDEE